MFKTKRSQFKKWQKADHHQESLDKWVRRKHRQNYAVVNGEKKYCQKGFKQAGLQKGVASPSYQDWLSGEGR